MWESAALPLRQLKLFSLHFISRSKLPLGQKAHQQKARDESFTSSQISPYFLNLFTTSSCLMRLNHPGILNIEYLLLSPLLIVYVIASGTGQFESLKATGHQEELLYASSNSLLSSYGT